MVVLCDRTLLCLIECVSCKCLNNFALTVALDMCSIWILFRDRLRQWTETYASQF